MEIEINVPDNFLLDEKYIYCGVVSASTMATFLGLQSPPLVTVNIVSYDEMKALAEGDDAVDEGIPYGYYFALVPNLSLTGEKKEIDEFTEVVFSCGTELYIRFDEENGDYIDIESIVLLVLHEFGHLLAYHNRIVFDTEEEHDEFADKFSSLAEFIAWTLTDKLMAIDSDKISKRLAAQQILKWGENLDISDLTLLLSTLEERKDKERNHV